MGKGEAAGNGEGNGIDRKLLSLRSTVNSASGIGRCLAQSFAINYTAITSRPVWPIPHIILLLSSFSSAQKTVQPKSPPISQVRHAGADAMGGGARK